MMSFLIHIKHVPSPFYSGVVFAGFGEKEVFPSCISYIVQGILCDKLQCRIDNKYRIGFSDALACIIPFAQADIVETIIQVRIPVMSIAYSG